jgi:hypothetical protein
LQDRYSGDIGDFGKFQLLRYLFNNTNYKIKQLWYLYPNENHNNDGMYIDYFHKIAGFDEVLENSLKNIIQNNRNVKSLEDARLLKNIEYFDQLLSKDACIEFRKKWFSKALEFSKNSEIILTDSDNGIALSCDKINKDLHILDYEHIKKNKSGKYIYKEEIEQLFHLSKCLIVYHHLNRCFKHDLQIEILLEKFKNNYGKVMAIKHKPYSPRVYFIFSKEELLYKQIVEKLLQFEKEFSIHWKLFL